MSAQEPTADGDGTAADAAHTATEGTDDKKAAAPASPPAITTGDAMVLSA